MCGKLVQGSFIFENNRIYGLFKLWEVRWGIGKGEFIPDCNSIIKA